MKLHSLAGIVVAMMASSCGGESASKAAPTDPAGAPSSAAPADKTAAGDPAPSNTSTDKSPSDTAKPSAPVKVAASMHSGGADLDVTFDTEGSGITIKVWGVDGLKVTNGATPTTMASVRSGQSVKVAVQYDEPATAANLAVSVSGTFGGREQVKVQSFTINAGAGPAKPPTGDVKVDGEGRRVKVMKQ